jgi:hypothetical protein
MFAVTDERPRSSRPVKDRRKSAMENNIFNATARVTRELTVSELDNVHGGGAPAKPASGGDMFLKMDGIDGESQDIRMKD